MRNLLAGVWGVAALGVMASMCGCGVQSSKQVAAQPGVINGHVHGGQQPVSNSTVQMYGVGTTGDGSVSATLLSPAVTSRSDGSFTLTGLYSCVGVTEVYITATGGDPAPGMANPNLAMMTALGPCSNLNAGTFITINEVTTVVAVSALQPFMTSATAIGSGTSDATALAAAFTLADELADPSTGTSPGPGVPTGMSAPTAEIYTLADIVAGCVNSGGGLAGASGGCGSLFTLTTPPVGAAPTDTIAALLNLARTPAMNTAALFALSAPDVPFQPTLKQAPTDFAIGLVPAQGVMVLQINPSSLSFPTTAVGFTSPQQTVTIQNIGTAAVPVEAITITGANGAEFGQANVCPSSLGIGSSCTVQVTATPAALGARSGYLTVVSGAGAPQNLPLTVTGGAAIAGPVTVSPTSLTGSNVFYIGGVPQDLTVSNLGNIPLTIRSLGMKDTNFVLYNFQYPTNFIVTNSTCGVSLPAQSVCTISVESTHTSSSNPPDPDTYTGTLTIDDDAAAGAQIVNLSSTNSASYNGGNFYTSASHSGSPTVFITLGGQDPGDFSYTLTQPQYGKVSDCQGVYPVVSGNSLYCTFASTFSPTAPGLRTAKAYVDYSNPKGMYIPLSGGTAVGSAFGVVSAFAASTHIPSSIDPNSVQAGMVALQNQGTAMFNFGGYLQGGNAAQFSLSPTLSTCTAVVTNAYCYVAFVLNTATTGTYTTNLVVKDANSNAVTVVPISGTVSYWTLSVSPTSLTFGNQALNTTSAVQTVTAADPLGFPLGHVITATLSDPNYTLTQSSCPASLTVVCTFGVAFAPTQASAPSSSLTLKDQTTGAIAYLIITGPSAPAGSPSVTLTNTPLTFPARSVGTTSIPMTVTLTNSGTAPLTVSGISVSGAVNGNFTQTNNCSTVAVQNTCSINVTFAPTAPGTQMATIKIVSNAASSPDSFTVSGTTQ